MTPKERAKLLRPQAVPLWLGLLPLAMFLIFAARAGKGLSPFLIGVAGAGAAGFFVSVLYHFFCRASIPKTVIKPMPYWRGAIVVLFTLPLAVIQTYGLGNGRCLVLSPTNMVMPAAWLASAGQLLRLFLTGNPTDKPIAIPDISATLSQPPFMGGALWGALGYATVFALAGMFFALLRQETFDPRQEPFGGEGAWPAARAAIGLYYGLSMGFWFGAALIWMGTMALGPVATPATQGLLEVIGAIPDPNRAFASGLSMAAWFITFATLFMGRADFTVGFTDPRPPEREPDMKIKIPDLPKSPPPDFDFSSIGFETEQIAAQFQSQLSDLARQLGFSDPVEPAASVLKMSDEDPAEKTEREPEVANIISARRPDFDVSFDSAMGQLSNVYVQVSAQLGVAELPLTEWLTMAEGTLLELPRHKDNTITLCINGKAVGRGKAVMIEDHKAIKVLKLAAEATQQFGR